AGTTAPNANPATAAQGSAVQLFSKAMGQDGGNNITAEFKNPGANSSPLSITVTNGSWRQVDPEDTNAADGFSQITIPTKDIVASLATDGTGGVTSRAGEVIAAINADPAASALVTAYSYAGNAGAGVVPATPSRAYNIPDGTTNTTTFNSTKRIL